jgi:uncharacterized protein
LNVSSTPKVSQASVTRPQPRATAETLAFWQACAQGKLIYQRCADCGRAQFPPRNRCSHCHADALAWHESARLGAIHTFTVVHRAPTTAFKSMLPYVIALIDLDEGFRMMMNLHTARPELLSIGDRVGVVFEPAAGDWPLPQAELAK